VKEITNIKLSLYWSGEALSTPGVWGSRSF